LITRRRLNLLIALLLPLMVLRGLLPAGYMPVARGGVITMALCSDGLPLPHPAGGADHPLPGSGGSDCPYAHATASAPPPAFVTLRATEFRPAGSVALHSAQLPALVIPRAQSSRGPPALQ
jgi:hypothetical protein